jgi:hypothetical protein
LLALEVALFAMPLSAPPPAPAFVAESDAQEPRGARKQAARDFWAAPLDSLKFLARAWAAIPVVELSLRVFGYKRTVAWIEAVPKKRSRAPGSSVPLGASLVRRAYRAHRFTGGCLPRSLVQYLLHRRDGTRARFVVGVRRPNENRGPGIEAHAWVETPGAAVSAAPRFAPIFHSEDP